mgnify:CR=1 FL=1
MTTTTTNDDDKKKEFFLLIGFFSSNSSNYFEIITLYLNVLQKKTNMILINFDVYIINKQQKKS